MSRHLCVILQFYTFLRLPSNAERVCTTVQDSSYPSTPIATITATDEAECCAQCALHYGCHTWTLNTSLTECTLTSWGPFTGTNGTVAGLIDYAVMIEPFFGTYGRGWGPSNDPFDDEFEHFPVQVRGTGIYQFIQNLQEAEEREEWEFTFTSANGSEHTRMFQVDESMIDYTEQREIYDRDNRTTVQEFIDEGYQPAIVVNFNNVELEVGSWQLERIPSNVFVDFDDNPNPELILQNDLVFTKIEANIQRSCSIGYEFIEFIVTGPPSLTITGNASVNDYYNRLDFVGMYTSETPTDELPENFPPIEEAGKIVFLHSGAGMFQQSYASMESDSFIDIMGNGNARFYFPQESYSPLVQLETVNITQDDDFFYLTLRDGSDSANETQLIKQENLCGPSFNISITLGPQIQVIPQHHFTFENDEVTIRMSVKEICSQSDCTRSTSFVLPLGLFYLKTLNVDGTVGTASAISHHTLEAPPQESPERPDLSLTPLAPWMIVVIVIAAIVGAILQALICCWFYKRWRRKKDAQAESVFQNESVALNPEYQKLAAAP